MKKFVLGILPLILLLFIFGYSKSFAQPSLKKVFKGYYMIGTALNDDQIFGRDPKAIALVEKHFNSITPENLLKWEKVHPKQGKYNFEPVDRLVEFCEKHNMFIVGHTLIWHNQTPSWVFKDEEGNPVTRDVLLNRLKEHIFAVVGKYKGRIQGWDVVNEAFEDNGEMRNTKWLQIIGKDYIQKAFEWAYEADPNAELYYNDYNMWYEGRRESVIKLVRELKSKGVKIDGVGLQGHWGLDYPPLDELEKSFDAYSKLDVKLMITELDMDILPLPEGNTGADILLNYESKKELNPFPNFLPDSMQVKQSNRFVEFFNLFNKYKDYISRVTFWGVQDGQSWRNFWPIRGRTAYPLLFDRSYMPKPAFFAVIKTVTGEK